MKERFKFIKGTREKYSIGSRGTVRNNTTGRVLKPEKDRGILKITIAIRKYNIRYKKPVHYMVAKHFIPNKNNYKYIDFIDGNWSNIDYKNLKWVSHRVFSPKAIKNRRKIYKEKYIGKNHWSSKPFKVGNKKFNTVSEYCEYVKDSYQSTIYCRLRNKNFKEYQYL